MNDRINSKIDWIPDLKPSGLPLYLAIADAIHQDITSGRLGPGERLPPQRRLASQLNVDFTTVARAYVEAQKRGIICSTVGRGTFIAPSATQRVAAADFSMNLPPEPDSPQLIAAMASGFTEISKDIVSLSRYQNFGGSPEAKNSASLWLARKGLTPPDTRLFITSGAHAALTALFNVLAKPGETILSEAITYPGARSIAGQLGIKLIGLTMDEHGITPDALHEACQQHQPRALYLNPTLQNPTTLTIPLSRRQALAHIARQFNLQIIEDDAYCFISSDAPPPFATLAPDLTWYIAGLSKCFGAGLRCAYVVAPDARAAWPFIAATRAMTVMASPLTAALATRWIHDGTGDALLDFIRKETTARQAMAADILSAQTLRADPLSFNIWLELPAPWTRAEFVAQMESKNLGIVPSDVFMATGTPPEAIRVCLGGPTKRHELRTALEFMAHILAGSPALTSRYL